MTQQNIQIATVTYTHSHNGRILNIRSYTGAYVNLINDSAISLVEGESILLCVGIMEEQFMRLDRMVPVRVTSDEILMKDKGEWDIKIM